MRDQIESAYNAWDGAFNRGDAEALAALYSENAKLLPPTHEMFEGRQAIKRFWEGLFRAGMTGHTLELITAEDNQRSAVGVAKWSARGKSRDGNEATFRGSVVHVFEKQQDSGLKLWLHIWN
jgi:ketosteroid isomerase-like protein